MYCLHLFTNDSEVIVHAFHGLMNLDEVLVHCVEILVHPVQVIFDPLESPVRAPLDVPLAYAWDDGGEYHFLEHWDNVSVMTVQGLTKGLPYRVRLGIV